MRISSIHLSKVTEKILAPLIPTKIGSKSHNIREIGAKMAKKTQFLPPNHAFITKRFLVIINNVFATTYEIAIRNCLIIRQ